MTSHLLPTYARVDLAFERGEGAWLIATNGERYLDFTSGVAVNALGHAHPHLVAGARPSRRTRSGTSPISIRIPEGERWPTGCARRASPTTCSSSNSGAEAMECAIKMARKYHVGQRRSRNATASSPSRAPSTAARWRRSPPAGNKKYLEGFGPPVDGFDQVPFGDLEAVKKAIGAGDRRDPDRADPGRGRRARAVPHQFLRALRELCDQHGLLLIFDEVQTGMGRTGELFAYQRTGVAPDIMALAKALGGGFPVGACLATARSRQGHDGRHARLDLRRQSAGDGGRQRRARRDARAAASSIACSRSALLLKQRLAEIKDRHPGGDRRSARRRPADRPARRRAGRRAGRRAARREDDHGRRRRQRGAAAAAADRQRGGNRRGDRAPRPRLRAACRAAPAAGSDGRGTGKQEARG